MKKHTKIYTDFFQIGEQDTPVCELCKHRFAIDVHHIEPRGMGGSKDKDYIENLMGLCRECHNAAESKKISKEKLRCVHKGFISQHRAWL